MGGRAPVTVFLRARVGAVWAAGGARAAPGALSGAPGGAPRRGCLQQTHGRTPHGLLAPNSSGWSRPRRAQGQGANW
jgi:hypothetical protein